MLIRSQNKEAIMNFDHIARMFIEEVIRAAGKEPEKRFAVIAEHKRYENREVLGYYTTKEKAMKAMDIITEGYIIGRAAVICAIAGMGIEEKSFSEYIGSQKMFTCDMPQENEV